MVGIELTTRCNFFCPHCYVSNRHHESSVLLFKDYKKIIDYLFVDEVLGLFLTGGEPLTLPNFHEYYEYAVCNGFLVSIFTNGYKLTEKTKKSILSVRPKTIELSLYGFSKETYMALTRIRDAYAKVTQNISWLLTKSFPLKVKYILMNENSNDVDKFVKYAEKQNIDYSINPALLPVLRDKKPDHKFRILPDSLKRIAKMYPTKISFADIGGEFACEAGDLLYITADLRVKGCPVLTNSYKLDCDNINPKQLMNLIRSEIKSDIKKRKYLFCPAWENIEGVDRITEFLESASIEPLNEKNTTNIGLCRS